MNIHYLCYTYRIQQIILVIQICLINFLSQTKDIYHYFIFIDIDSVVMSMQIKIILYDIYIIGAAYFTLII